MKGQPVDGLGLPKYRPLSLLLVEYREGDRLGFLMAWISMIPVLIPVALLTTMILRRDLTTIFFSFGVVLTEISNAVLKRVFKQPRPVKDSLFQSGNHGKYGMPSDHSQHIFYLATFFILLIINRCYFKTNNKSYQYLVKGSLILGAEVTAMLVAYSRVYLEYHTVEQVIIGGAIGSISGAVWFFLVHYIFSRYFAAITLWKVSEFLMIRDYSPIPNVQLFQYTVERNEAGIRRIKNKVQ